MKTTTKTKRRFVNIYFVTQEYGGPEEGGWWYFAGTPVKEDIDPDYDSEYDIVPYLSFETTDWTGAEARIRHEAVRAEQQAWCDKQNEDRPPLTSVNSRGIYEARVERHQPTSFPKERPHYE